MFPVSVFLHYFEGPPDTWPGRPSEEMIHEPLTLDCPSFDLATRMTVAFNGGNLAPIWDSLPLDTKRRIRDLGVDLVSDCGATSAHVDSVERYAPNLLD